MTRKHGILSRISRFLRDGSGNFGVTMGLMAFPMIGAMALAVDYSNLMRDKTAAQASLDAAALAAAKEYSSGALTGADEAETKAKIQAYANDFFLANLPDSIDHSDVAMQADITVNPRTDANGTPFNERTIALTADVEYDTFLAKTLGHDTLVPKIAAQVAIGNITVELAFVMDNSGSMSSNSRLTLAKNTAKAMVDDLFAAAKDSNRPDPIKISLVPFAGMVNVGTEHKDANWMDRKGWAPIHHENLDWDTYVHTSEVEDFRVFNRGPAPQYRRKVNGSWEWMTRHHVFDMLGAEWGGCVEARPWPHSTQDTVQMINSNYNNVRNNWKDGGGLDALFVPNFAPNEPSRAYRGNGKFWWDWHNYGFNRYLYRSGWNNQGDFRKLNPNNDKKATWIDSTDNYSAYGNEYNDGVVGTNQHLRQNWIWRYQAAAVDNAVSIGSNNGYWNSGPNLLCSTKPLTPLTDDQQKIKQSINEMVASGSTNIQEGIAWGWRTLSKGEPFTEGREYGDPDNRKYLIALTDGNNWMNWSSNGNGSSYSGWGYAKHGRLEEGLDNDDRPDLYKNVNLSSNEMKMNVHTLQTCENAKNAGITIFAIAFDVSDGSSVKDLLQACGGSGLSNGRELMPHGEFYYDVNGAALDDAMAAITEQISAMRLHR